MVSINKDEIAQWTERHGRPPSILFMVDSTNGFGHFNTAAEVCSRMRDMGADVCIASSTAKASEGIFDMKGVKQHSLPPVLSRRDPEKGKQYITPKGTLYKEDTEYQALRADKLKAITEEFTPDIVVFDIYPFAGSNYRIDDMNALKSSFADTSADPSFICLGRDIMHSHNPQRVLGALEDFDHILVHSDGVMNKLQDCQEDWHQITTPIEYMGNVIRDLPVRDDTINDAERPLMVFAGGGYNPSDEALFKTAIEARSHSAQFRDNPWKIVVSEKCPEPIFQELVERARDIDPSGTKIIVTKPYNSADFTNDIANCAGAIIGGSYNVTTELLYYNMPFVTVPRFSDEQIMRADLLERHGLARKFPQEEFKRDQSLTESEQQTIATRLAETLDSTRTLQSDPTLELDYNGADRMAQRMVELACKQRESNILGRTNTQTGAARGYGTHGSR
ncbi:MAG TPA: hypothetical protein VFT64_02290 [Rickettsiales bacterium]|nr:hypothetical protein [Rickettsiales bacterium]